MMVAELVLGTIFLLLVFIAILFFVIHFGMVTGRQIRDTNSRLDAMNEDIAFIKKLYKEDFAKILSVIKTIKNGTFGSN